ncbi:MAG: outer membrane receptor protein involved in Fe transport [Crocinitomix sp.]|jgi:outer membrane receptor protein involved in Fe transport
MRYFLLITTLFFTMILAAQPPQGGGGMRGGGDKPGDNKGEIFGNIIDSISNEALAYVTILALKLPENKTVGGAVTSDNGNFSIPDLPVGTYTLKISFVGYDVKLIKAVKLTEDQITYNLKDLQLAPSILDVVEVSGDMPEIRYEIDKKIINVEDQLNTDGQTAIEILENIPSITVSADGTVSLRGSSSFTLLIDGIPTILDANDALATIPANTIKDIEIITNPSARYDAEGTSGVINIITKKNKLQGVSCLVNLSAGRFNNYSGDIALNLKKNAFTFDLGANISDRGRPNETIETRTTTYDSVVNVLRSEGENNWRRQGWGVNGGVQWAPNNSHVLVLRSNYRSNVMIPYSNFAYLNYDDDSLISDFYNEQNNNIDFTNSSTSLYYQYNIKRNKDHNISVKAVLNIKDVVQFDTTLSYNNDGTIRSGNLYTETGPSNSVRFNIDYRLPLKKDKKFEAGLQSQIGSSGDVGRNYVYNTSTTVFDFDPLLSSDVEYARDIHAAYSMFSGKYKRLGYQLGLRAEYTLRNISSSTAVNFTEINRLDLFPSAHFSYSLKNKSQILLSYSRRIERPRSYYFEPFITWESPFNVRTGNPNLLPEYINAFEVSYIKPIKQKGYFSLEGYFRKSNGIINRISTVYEQGILISQPYNIGSSESYGLEATLTYKLKRWWKINASGNAYMFNLKGSLNDVDYSRESFNYTGRLTNTFTLKGFMIQLVSRYNSGSVIAQGESFDSFTQDLSVRKSFMKKRFSVSLSGRNLFGTQRRGSITTTENVEFYSISKPLAPQITLSVSIKLNNYQKAFERSEQMDDF